MRKFFFWFGWAVLFACPVVYGIQIYRLQTLPRVAPWEWAIPLVAIAVIFFSRNRDDVLKHHLV
ncbi:MAG TPA: hypothetical protein VNL91_03525 [Thermoanaerobaculia bacterium]|nr:hypothetical protein [Thermoanaerobaculia bacterium]